MKQNTKKTNSVKGFGFIDARFGVKDIAMEYEDLQGGPTTESSIKPFQMANKNNKIEVVKKEPIANKKVEKIPVIAEKKIEMDSHNNK